MLLRILLFCGFLGSVVAADAQETPRGDTYFFLGIGFSLSRLYDAGHSTQLYQGIPTSLRIGHERIGQNSISRVMVSSSFGTGTPTSKPKPKKQLSSVDFSHIQISYTYYQRVNDVFDPTDLNPYAGGVFTVNVDINNYSLPSNNLLGFHVSTALNVGGMLRGTLSERYVGQYEAFTPILSAVLRPNYIGMLPFTSGDIKPAAVLGMTKVVTMNKLFRFYQNITIDQAVNDHRQRRFSYSIDSWSSRVSKPMKRIETTTAYHSLFKM